MLRNTYMLRHTYIQTHKSCAGPSMYTQTHTYIHAQTHTHTNAHVLRRPINFYSPASLMAFSTYTAMPRNPDLYAFVQEPLPRRYANTCVCLRMCMRLCVCMRVSVSFDENVHIAMHESWIGARVCSRYICYVFALIL
jgi:hypothetical protein